MATCNSCGGAIGRDCFNPPECAEITRQMAYNGRQELEHQVRLLEWRAKRAEDFLDGYSAAPTAAKSVLAGEYDHEFAAITPDNQTGAE